MNKSLNDQKANTIKLKETNVINNADLAKNEGNEDGHAMKEKHLNGKPLKTCMKRKQLFCLKNMFVKGI